MLGMGQSTQDCQVRFKNHNRPPFWVKVVLVIGDFIMRRLWPRRVTGREHYTASPATIVISNHRHDVDGPLLGSVLLRRHGLRLIAPLPHFVAREDLFERGFLAHYIRRWPTRLRSVLACINLRWFLTRCGAYPLQRTHERNVAEVLHEIVNEVGDMPVADALRPGRIGTLAHQAGFNRHHARLTDVVRGHNFHLWRTRYGYRHLRLAIFQRLKPYLYASIERQIDHFAALLEHGHMVILEPEGRLSLDGRLRRPRAALHAFINRTNRAVRVLPVCLTYDTLTTGKSRIFVDIQPEMTDLQGLTRKDLDQRIMTIIRSGCRVTGGQLAAAFFLHHGTTQDVWSENVLSDHLYHTAQQCHAAGLSLDPCLLERHDCNLRTRDILTWAVGAGLLRRQAGHGLRVINPALPAPWLPDGPTTLLSYLQAELIDTVGKTRAVELGLVP